MVHYFTKFSCSLQVDVTAERKRDFLLRYWNFVRLHQGNPPLTAFGLGHIKTFKDIFSPFFWLHELILMPLSCDQPFGTKAYVDTRLAEVLDNKFV